MIENLRGRSTETKYGRTPLWLYETGVGLQAIATYGWLHGRYGHYERVMPSYATLAKELGVSRGSVIAYVKTLVSVGAVRIETSGAAGQQTNVYVIAFNEPFPVSGEVAGGGQNADHLVSGLYPAGQNADPGGQPVVHEEDVLRRRKKTLSPPPSPGPRPAATPAADERETEAAPPTTTAERVIRTAAVVTPDEEQQFIDWATTRHTPRGPGWWRTTAANGDLPDLAQTWRTEHAPAATGPALPAWCGQCGDGMPAAAFNPRFRQLDGRPCPDCHPDRHAA